jgi:hypothetical protein
MNIKSIKSVLFSFTLLAALASCNKANDVTEQYMRGGNSLAIAADDNLIIAGYNSSAKKGYQATLIKVKALDGDTIWMKAFGGSYADAFYSVNVSHEGGFVATGFTNLSTSNYPAMAMVITNDSGVLIKSALYGGSSYSQGFCVLPLEGATNGYLFSGYFQKSVSADRDIYLVKTNNSGVVLWSKTIGAKSDPYDTVNDAAYAVIEDPKGGFFVTGSLNGGISSGGKIFLMKVSAAGDSLWTRTFGFGIGYSLTLTHDAAGIPDGGLAIGGSWQDGDNQCIVIIKTDTSKTGQEIWRYPTTIKPGFEYGANMVETSDKGLAITGITGNEGSGSRDVYLLKVNNSGSKDWAYPYGSTGVEEGFGLVQTKTGDFCIDGLSNSGGSFYLLIKTDKDGALAPDWPLPDWTRSVQ